MQIFEVAVPQAGSADGGECDNGSPLKAHPGTSAPDAPEASDALWRRIADQLAFGIVLVDRKRRLQFASKTALEQVRATGALRLAGGVVDGAIARETRALQDAVDAACRGLRTYLRSGAWERALDMAVIPLSEKPDAGAAIIFGHADTGTPGCLRAFAASYGVTPAEVRLLAMLASGATVRQAADRIGVKVSTARAQVQSLFLRTFLDSLRDLTIRVWQLPPVAGADSIDAGSRVRALVASQ